MDEVLWALLRSSSAVTALVPAAHIYWGDVPDGSRPPAITLNIVDGTDEPHLQGTDGLWRYRVQVDCLDVSRPKSRMIARAVIDALNGVSSGGLIAFLISQADQTDEGVNPTPYASLDFNIIWRA